ncbi:Hypothetical predicted protein [Paramuricea clavata]|nr:Hypothetical predicted protein [Paramuricea clavata]
MFLSLMIFFSVLPKYSQQTFWRRPKPTLPSNPNAPVYKQLQNIPSPQKTAQMILDNFVRYQPDNQLRLAKRSPPIQEDTVIVMDASGSIGSCEFEQGKIAMSQMMKMCKVKAKKAGLSYDCRYAGVSFSNSATLDFNFSPINQASKKIRTVTYPGWGTNTHAGLEEAEKVIRAGLYREILCTEF